MHNTVAYGVMHVAMLDAFRLVFVIDTIFKTHGCMIILIVFHSWYVQYVKMVKEKYVKT